MRDSDKIPMWFETYFGDIIKTCKNEYQIILFLILPFYPDIRTDIG